MVNAIVLASGEAMMEESLRAMLLVSWFLSARRAGHVVHADDPKIAQSCAGRNLLE
jgi:hypothetical protein